MNQSIINETIGMNTAFIVEDTPILKNPIKHVKFDFSLVDDVEQTRKEKAHQLFDVGSMISAELVDEKGIEYPNKHALIDESMNCEALQNSSFFTNDSSDEEAVFDDEESIEMDIDALHNNIEMALDKSPEFESAPKEETQEEVLPQTGNYLSVQARRARKMSPPNFLDNFRLLNVKDQ